MNLEFPRHECFFRAHGAQNRDCADAKLLPAREFQRQRHALLIVRKGGNEFRIGLHIAVIRINIFDLRDVFADEIRVKRVVFLEQQRFPNFLRNALIRLAFERQAFDARLLAFVNHDMARHRFFVGGKGWRAGDFGLQIAVMLVKRLQGEQVFIQYRLLIPPFLKPALRLCKQLF